MSSTVITAIISLIGTLVGTFAGIVTSNRLMLYRIEQLERKMDKHNGLIEKTYKTEESVKSAHKRIDEIIKKG